MAFELKLALRYLRARRKGLVRFTSAAAVTGIAAGVAGLIFAQAVSGGFSAEIRDKVLAHTAHITVYSDGDTRFADPGLFAKRIGHIDNIERVAPTTYESAVITSDAGTAYAVIRVVPDERPPRTSAGSDPGSSGDPRPAIGVGRELAAQLGLRPGDAARLVTPGEAGTPRAAEVRVTGVFETGLYEYDATWIRLDERDYPRVKGAATFEPRVFSVSVRDIYASDATAERIREALGPGFRVIDWQEANKPLFAALSLERRAALAVILLIVFIAALNITTTLSLLVAERRADIAVLRTCGARTRNIAALFLFEGLLLGAAGTAAGTVLGLTACFLADRFRLIGLPQEVYSIGHVPLRIDPGEVLLIALLTFLLSLAAIVYPALKASRIKPSENLRTG